MPAPFLKVLWGHSFWKIKLAVLFITLPELSCVRVEEELLAISHPSTKAPQWSRGIETLPNQGKCPVVGWGPSHSRRHTLRLVMADQGVWKYQSDGIVLPDTMKYCTLFQL